jgi:uncharacterized protein
MSLLTPLLRLCYYRDVQTDQKWGHLRSLLADMKMAVIAFSGGVDSALLLRAAAEVLGQNVLAVTAVSATYSPGELDHAKAYAGSLGIRHRIIPSAELDLEEFVRNAPDRCYHCKRDLFGLLKRVAESEGISFVLDGSNADDCRDYRPGRKAAEELGVRSPLGDVGLTKAEIRDLARAFGMPMWNKPSLACLSSRIPYGTRITPELLRTVDAAEDIVRKAGVRQVRVRHHGDTARIEVAPGEFASLMNGDVQRRIVREIKELGYTYVCLDLEGYRTGSMNEILASEQKTRAV